MPTAHTHTLMSYASFNRNQALLADALKGMLAMQRLHLRIPASKRITFTYNVVDWTLWQRIRASMRLTRLMNFTHGCNCVVLFKQTEL